MKQIFEVLLLVFSAVSAVVLTLLYSSITIFLHKQKGSMHMASEIFKCRAKENRKVTCMHVMVVIVFYAAWIPYHVRFFLLNFKPNMELPYFLSTMAQGLPSLYTAVNPTVYSYLTKSITEVSKNCCVVYGPVMITSAVTRQLHL